MINNHMHKKNLYVIAMRVTFLGGPYLWFSNFFDMGICVLYISTTGIGKERKPY